VRDIFFEGEMEDSFGVSVAGNDSRNN
jgi:hypothetical protein